MYIFTVKPNSYVVYRAFRIGSLDYRSIESTDVTFNVGTNQVCINVMIFNDNILENDEFFTVSLASLSTGVSILTGSSTVEIRDNDGGCF